MYITLIPDLPSLTLVPPQNICRTFHAPERLAFVAEGLWHIELTIRQGFTASVGRISLGLCIATSKQSLEFQLFKIPGEILTGLCIKKVCENCEEPNRIEDLHRKEIVPLPRRIESLHLLHTGIPLSEPC